jgi:hypothetical protein
MKKTSFRTFIDSSLISQVQFELHGARAFKSADRRKHQLDF